jgi:response regulator RpfG family c-di-GMP phosphodiesterase
MKLVRTKKNIKSQTTGIPGWKVLVVDDDSGIHAMTKLNLRDFSYQNRNLELLHAYSAKEAMLILQKEKHIALALIDVVMEENDAGLQLVEYIRNTLNNNLIRLIIRTGQPGVAPEREIIDNYDIDGYQDKSELTVQKFYTLVRTSLKGYHDLKVIDTNRLGLDLIIKSTHNLYLSNNSNANLFFSGILTQMTALCNLDGILLASTDGFVVTATHKVNIEACVGNFCEDKDNKKVFEIHQRWGKSILDGQDIPDIPDNAIMTRLYNAENVIGYIYLEGMRLLNSHDRHLIEVMSNQISTAMQNIRLQSDLRESNRDALLMLAEASEYKDGYTGEHLMRIRSSTIALSLAFGLDAETAERYGDAAILHDIGKMGIPDNILQKPTNLSTEEFNVIKDHPLIGASILKRNQWFSLARDCASSHHERWNGKGYPKGLKGNEIPLIGRIVAVTDVFDALSHARPYKNAWALPKVVETIQAGSGTQFEPLIIDAFMSLYDQGKLNEFI